MHVNTLAHSVHSVSSPSLSIFSLLWKKKMNKFDFIRDGRIISKLPPGFRFQPTDEEIVYQYLARKIFSCPLPASVIPEINNIFTFNHPSELPSGDSDQDRYFFSNRESKYVNRSSKGKPACSHRHGFWKVTGLERRIGCSKRKMMPVVGIRKTLVFYQGKHPRATRTDWFMHVYCVALSGNCTPSNSVQIKKHSDQDCLMPIGKWVLCHVFLKKRSTKADQVQEDNGRLHKSCYRDFMAEDISDTHSSSASSSSSCSDSDSSVPSEVSSSGASDESATP